MDYYNNPEKVKQYIKMCEGYDGRNIYKFLNQFLGNGSTLLELGCGAGLDISYLQKQYKITGSDLSEEFLKLCKNKFPKINFLKLDALHLEINMKFDCIYSNKVLHHLTDKDLSNSLCQQKTILHSNGLIAHSFWMGNQNVSMNDMIFTYYTKKYLFEILSENFEVLDSLNYQEFEKNDSLFVIARLKQ